VTGGRVASLNVSDGGVPKRAVESAEVTRDGMRGDRQRNLKYHGGRERALCLWSLERIEALRGEGHPVSPGSTGENVTVAGLEWAALAPGVRLRIGPVLAEVTDYTRPCRTIARSFLGGRSGRVSQKTHPGWSRVYARVLEEGRLAVGDAVIVVASGS
jgi:MOSC domain-containing protein YiiM